MNPRVLKELGIDWPWLAAGKALLAPSNESERSVTPVSQPQAPARPSSKKPENVEAQKAVPLDPARVVRIETLSWDDLPRDIESCRACELHQGRHRPVPGVGDPKAEWLFVGEGPGAEEDQKGEPFVGAAGQLLDRMLDALGLRRTEVFIANVVKCRPPGNRTPSPDECAACSPYLKRQIELIQPKVIVALGRVAAHALLETEFNLGSLRGQVHRFQEIPVIVTYHPAYLLRNLPEKARAWQDLCLAKKTLKAQGM